MPKICVEIQKKKWEKLKRIAKDSGVKVTATGFNGKERKSRISKATKGIF